MNAAIPIVSRREAMKRPTHHQFLPGVGFIAHSAEPDLPDDAVGSKNCSPPAGTRDRTHHALQPPGGHPEMAMVWLAAEGAWMHPHVGRGNRVAWTPAHLSRAGWEYVGPGKPKPKKKREAAG